ncbi:MAG: nitronate monooxygenase [Pseudomonadota bacterium]|nr:nitronate monooxygenase [Pseudomonadota bacterium]
MMIEKIETDFTRQFNVRFPIISAPMYLVSNVEMVVRTNEAGGLGTFPALNYRPIENFGKAVKETKSRTVNAFGINLIVQKSNKYQHAQLDLILENKVPLVITSLGSPREVIRRAHAAGTKVYCDVVGLEHAKKVVDLGADGIIAVGSGAGGHAGETSLFSLIPYLKKNLKVPIVAAGSIVDGKGMAAALALGASAIYMGTRFIATKESPASASYKKAIVSATPEDIINTDKVDGFPGNFILNDGLKKVGLRTGLIESAISQIKPIKKWLALARAARSLLASENSKVSYKNVFSAGYGVGMIDNILSIEEVMKNTVQEYLSIKENLP